MSTRLSVDGVDAVIVPTSTIVASWGRWLRRSAAPVPFKRNAARYQSHH